MKSCVYFSLLIALSIVGSGWDTELATGQIYRSASHRSPNVAQPNRITLNSATAAAVQASPSIQKLQSQIDVLRGQSRQQSRLVNPSVGVIANEVGNEGQAGQYGLYLQRNLVRNNRVAQTKNAFGWRIQSLRRQRNVLERDLARKLGNLFVEWGFLKRKIELNQQRRVELRKIREFATSLWEAGEIPELQLSRIDLELQRLNLKLNDWQLHKQRVEQTVPTYFGDGEEVRLDFDLKMQSDQLIEALEANAATRSATESSAVANGRKADFELPLSLSVDFDNHPQLLAVDDRVQQQHWQIELARSQQLPDWQVQSSVNYDAATDDFFAGFQLNVPWMVQDRKLGAIQAAQSSLEVLLAERQRLRMKLEQESLKLINGLQSNRQKIRMIREKSMPLIDRNLSRLTAVFTAGEANYQDVQTAMDLGYDIREQLAAARRDFLLHYVHLQSLTVE